MTPLDRISRRYQATLCGSTCLMVALSCPLWLNDPDFPRVPFFPSLPILTDWLTGLMLAGILIALALATWGRAGRVVIGVSLVFLAISVVQDQNRFQPWVYQYEVVGLALACLARRRALLVARWYTISLYAYSGFSKLDASFCQELGPIFLEAGLRPLGLSSENWPDATRTLAVLAMPGCEIVVAGLLAFGRTRRLGLVGSIAQHGLLIAILGPWNLGHSTIVLVWNLAQIAENLVLFGPTELPADDRPDSRFAPLARLIFGVALILPLGERWGLCDAWPAHALYASHAERSDVYIHEDDLDRFPEPIRRRLGPANLTSWRRLDLTGWSRDVRGTPTYPSGRVGNAVAEFLETRYGGVQPIRLVQWSRASMMTARRDRDESLGLKAIRRRGDQFWINAHPRP